ncbi:ABC transporter ATP-binding protein [Gulbenkiania mobilis]|uniref:ABC transporter ATP-binding protein n=1 Tax=Gulbenkiania mobilis TaxID=397457 RepID=UPI0006BC0BBC|nr:dipeptide ABC transporter ATP-binding protein [Gulbenkiania mobilis]
MEPLLQVEGLGITFGASRVVEEVTFSLMPGEKLALVGESGSGKSVTAQALLRLQPDATVSGSVRFAGQSLTSLGEDGLRRIRGRDIAMIFQEPMSALNPVMTVGRQIGEVLTLHRGLPRRAARDEAIRLLGRTGLDRPEERVDAYPFQLSGGQRQRAMIAMALACQPRLLIADEPTTALDVTVQAQILALLETLQRETGMAVLFITHDLNLVRRFADRVAVMSEGRIVETGPVQQVFGQPAHPYTCTLLASRPEPLVEAGTATPPVRLEARGIRVSFRQRSGWFRTRFQTVLHDVDLLIPAGRTLGVVGESGSGKTTLGLAVTRLIDAQGTVALDGEPLFSLKGEALRRMRRHFQVVFQDPFAALSPRMTVAQIVGEGLAQHFPGQDLATRQAAVAEALAEVGLPASAMERYPHEFSGGQRQRIAIARALVVRPRLIVFDEPTSALDATLQKQVLKLLVALQERHGLSYLFISHDLAVIRAVAHEVLVLRAGQVVEQGPTAQLFAAPRDPYTRTLLAAALGEAD